MLEHPFPHVCGPQPVELPSHDPAVTPLVPKAVTPAEHAERILSLVDIHGFVAVGQCLKQTPPVPVELVSDGGRLYWKDPHVLPAGGFVVIEQTPGATEPVTNAFSFPTVKGAVAFVAMKLAVESGGNISYGDTFPNTRPDGSLKSTQLIFNGIGRYLAVVPTNVSAETLSIDLHESLVSARAAGRLLTKEERSAKASMNGG